MLLGLGSVSSWYRSFFSLCHTNTEEDEKECFQKENRKSSNKLTLCLLHDFLINNHNYRHTFKYLII